MRDEVRQTESTTPAPTADNATWMWHEYAQSYDRVLLELSFYREVLDRHLSALTHPDIRHVVDLGAGTGNLAIRLLEAGCRVTAVDLNPCMLEHLRAKLPKRPGPIRIIEQSATSLPQLRDRDFDAVTILLALYAVDTPEVALGEAVRLLKPGGLIVVTEPKRCFRLEPLLEFGEACLRKAALFDALHEDWDRVCRANRLFDPGLGAPLRAEGIEDELRDRGFEEVSLQDSHLGYCATVRGRKPLDAAENGTHSARPHLG